MTTPARGTPEWHAFLQNARDRNELRNRRIAEETAIRERDPAVRAAVRDWEVRMSAAFDRLDRDVRDAWKEEGYVATVEEEAKAADEMRTLELYDVRR